MTNLMFELRRSPRTLLTRDGHPGPGPGHLAVVLARAGVGKTAFLVGIGIDALLSGQKVLHVSLERTVEMLRREKKLEHWAAIQLEVEKRRHIHTYLGNSFNAGRLRDALELLRDAADFVPNVIILDRMEMENFDPEIIEAAKKMAGDVGAELWMACRTHRDEPGSTGHLPPPADRFEHLVDTAFRLDPQDKKVRLHVAKDKQKMLGRDLNVVLDPKTLLLDTGIGAKR
jgi:hypothetical protein